MDIADRNDQEISIVTVCLGIYFMLMVFDSIPMFGIGSILKVMILLPLGAIIVVKMRSSLELNPQTILFAIYCLFLAFSYIYSINREETFKQITRIFLNMTVILCAGGMYEYNAREIEFLKISLVAGGVITIFLTLVLSDYSAGGRLTLSINGNLQDQNFLNGYIFYAYIYFLSGLIERKKMLMLIPTGGILLFTLMTGSRGALLALLAISAMIVLCVFIKEKRIGMKTFVIAGIAVILVIVLYRPVLSLLPEEVAVRFTPEYIEEYGSTGRSAIWLYLLNRYSVSGIFRTLFGYGFGTVAYLNEYNHLVAHNMWIEHLLAVGAIGLLIFVCMQAAYFAAAWRSKEIFVISAYTGYLVMMLSLTLLSYKPIWNCMIMILIISNYHKRQLLLRGEGNSER